MPAELYHQRVIIEDTKKISNLTFAVKLSHRFMSGIPDLLLSVPGYQPVFVEVKKVDANYKKDTIKIGTTPLQRATMKAMTDSGLRCEVWVAVEDGADTRMLRVRPEMTTVQCDIRTLPRRKRGEGWPIAEFLSNPV